MAQKKSFKELDLNSAFLFAAALEDEETCRLVLECILDKPIGAMTVKPEREILYNSDFRCVRLDIFASDKMHVEYNLEMQNENEGNLPKRSRYHQAEMDLASLKPGQDFNYLPPSFIVFICNFDPFGRKLYRYTFEPRCQEADFILGDETKRIFLNTKGENAEEVSSTLVEFLNYVTDSTDDYVAKIGDSKVKKIHAKVKALKQSRELEERYMRFEELLEKEHTKGTKETLELVSRMVEDGKAEQIPRLKNDQKFYEEMLETYQL